jgi:hypothetical protein
MRFPTWCRIALVLVAGCFSIASSRPPDSTPPPEYGGDPNAQGQPPGPPPGEPGQPGQPQPGQPSQPGPGGRQWGAISASYACFSMRSGDTQGSLCFGSFTRCARERQQATRDGAQTGECRMLAPVSCFQLGGDPNPSNEVCAATPQDCELWRLVDKDKNGATGSACEWRHFQTQRRRSAPPPQQVPVRPEPTQAPTPGPPPTSIP